MSESPQVKRYLISKELGNQEILEKCQMWV